MEDDGAVGGAAHAPVGDAHHVAHALLQQLLGQAHFAFLRHAGEAARTNPLEHHHTLRGDIEIGVVDALVVVFNVLEDDGAPTVLQQFRRGRGRFDHRAVRTEIAVEDRRA